MNCQVEIYIRVGTTLSSDRNHVPRGSEPDDPASGSLQWEPVREAVQVFARGAYFCPPPAFRPEMDAKEWLNKLEDFFRASGVPTMDYGAVGRYLLTDPVRRELYPPGQATNSFHGGVEGTAAKLVRFRRVAGIPRSGSINGRVTSGSRKGRLPGDPAAGTANPRRSSKAGHQDNPCGGRLPGKAAAPRRRGEDREVGDGREGRRYDKGDGQPGEESGTTGTNSATAPQDYIRMLPLWQPGPSGPETAPSFGPGGSKPNDPVQRVVTGRSPKVGGTYVIVGIGIVVVYQTPH
ncbi:hypothetical protein T4E_975 [Trichinella pseudospiralis]|uniref:Uncharacterized protein n=1 Tax=Trichinella pseudospiralis TaxID=6337 RepID=A0A0V0XMR7_TRIPS|nr:hypothetical protein T4E_975 [Trichinella pseudospiralis]